VGLYRGAPPPAARVPPPSLTTARQHVDNMPSWDPAVVACTREPVGAVADKREPDAGAVTDKEAASTSLGPVTLGTTYSMLTVFRGQRSRMRYRVTRWTPSEVVEFVGSSFALTSTERIAFKEGPGGTRVSWRAVVRFRWLLAWLAPLLRSSILATGPAAQAGMLSAFAAGRHTECARAR